MVINDSFISKRGEKWNVEYSEVETIEELDKADAGAAGALCFCDNKLVVVYAEHRQSWEMPGGGRERTKEESITECIVREIKEETNMQVINLVPLGVDILTNTVNGMILRQARFAAIVEPEGDFILDPDGDITEIKTIEPKEYKKYFDWGERSDAMVRKALEKLQLNLVQ